MVAFFKKHSKSLLLAASLLLNALGGAGIIPPFIATAASNALSNTGK